MASCPYCNTTSNTYNLSIVLHNKKAEEYFFKQAKILKCVACFKSFRYIMMYYYTYRGQENFNFIGVDDEYLEISITLEYFDKLKRAFSSQLVNYLPNDNLKRTYEDAKAIMDNEHISNELKMGSIRPILEAFINYENNVAEDDKIRIGLKTLKQNNPNNLPEDLYSRLQKILDETLKGVHIKVEKLKHDPTYVLKVLETLFTKIYWLPKEKKNLEEYITKETAKIDNLLKTQIQFLKDN